MVISKRHLLLAMILFMFPFFVTAETVNRFAWSSDYALRYEVVFERIVNENYVLHLQEFTAEQYIDLSLPVGSYRFRIIPYDILDRPSEPSEWRYIEVIPVPGSDTQVESRPVFEPMREPDPEPEQIPVSELQPEPEIPPQVIEREPKERTYLFDPLGAVLCSAGAAWSPVLPVYGNGFGNDFSIFSSSLRMSVVFLTPLNIYLGPELIAIYDVNDVTNLIAGVNILAMKWLPYERCALSFKFGVAASLVSDDDVYNIFNTGAAIRWRVTNSILLEAGFDFQHMFTLASGGLRPWIGIGYQF
ncbi:MAG: procyclic acidic repetitive family protein [Treponema sp.]|nr:procyclic acidic repetitive family protein [Treponema sp.]